MDHLLVVCLVIAAIVRLRLSAFDGTAFVSSPIGGTTVVRMDLPRELRATTPAT